RIDPEPLEQRAHVPVLRPHAVLAVIERVDVLAVPLEAIRLSRPRAPAEELRMGLAQHDLLPAFCEVDRCGQAREPGPDDDDLLCHDPQEQRCAICRVTRWRDLGTSPPVDETAVSPDASR